MHWIPHRISSIALAFMLVLAYSMQAAGAQSYDGASYSDSTTYNGVLYAVQWSDNVTSYYNEDFNGNRTLSSQVQGGCYNNAQYLSQTVSGSVTFYWPGGSQGPVYSTIVDQQAAFCPAGSALWGNGPTYNDPIVVFLKSDPPGSDYIRIFSQWYCGSCSPWYSSKQRDWVWIW